MSGAESENKALVTKVTILKAAANQELSSNALEPEDEFQDLYDDGTGAGAVLQPPFPPKRLLRLVQENNALGQCIAAMEVNIDGTGFSIEPEDAEAEDAEDDAEIKRLEGFYKEPYPGESLITIRKALRVDLESIGYGCLEVIRNPAGEIVFVHHVDAAYIRLMKLGRPVSARKSLIRDGKLVEITMKIRERAFVQKMGQETVYFKEFGASRDINKVTGAWGEPGQKLPSAERGTEILYFTMRKDSTSPYGVPRWINQLPSALGSRKAEELNLDYFDAGGVPPAVVFVGGGQFSEPAKKALENVFSGKAKDKLRVAVCEVQSTSGDINAATSVQINVTKFGQEMVNDSMFEGYDEKCEKRIRSSFRLPPMFVGKAEDYSYASAFASYSVAEAQVFQPERVEFDEILNVTLMRAMGADRYEFKSKSLSVHDAVIQLKAVELSGDDVSPKDRVETLNDIATLRMKYDEEGAKGREEQDTKDKEAAREAAAAVTPVQTHEGEATPTEPPKKSKVSKVDPFELAGLADDMAILMGLREGKNMTEDFKTDTIGRVETLSKYDRDMYDALFAARTMERVGEDPESAARISHHATSMLGKWHG